MLKYVSLNAIKIGMYRGIKLLVKKKKIIIFWTQCYLKILKKKIVSTILTEMTINTHG